MDEDTIKQIDRYCRRGFSYLADTIDTWRSHLAEVNAGKVWYGDCDDLATTTLDMLGRRGLPLTRRYRLLVSSVGGLNVDHMVAAARDQRGILWVVGDTFAPAYLLINMRHQPLLYQRMDRADTVTWYKGRPS